MKLRIRRKSFRFWLVAIIAAGIGILCLLFAALWPRTPYSPDPVRADPPDDGRVLHNGQIYLPKENLDVLLLIGVDKYQAQIQQESYNNSQQSDFILLLLLDKDAKTYTALHLNRDTMAEIPILGVRGEKAGSMHGQLALAHTYGSGGRDSCRNTVQAVSTLLYDIDIDRYISVTMDAVAQINDLVGGVTLTVTEDLSKISPELIPGAHVRLSGDLALSFVRTRGGLTDSSNLSRMRRQQQYLTALYEAVINAHATDEAFFAKALAAISNDMTSNCTADQLSKLYDRLLEYQNNGVYEIPGNAVSGATFIEYHPDEPALKQLVLDLFYVPQKENE